MGSTMGVPCEAVPAVAGLLGSAAPVPVPITSAPLASTSPRPMVAGCPAGETVGAGAGRGGGIGALAVPAAPGTVPPGVVWVPPETSTVVLVLVGMSPMVTVPPLAVAVGGATVRMLLMIESR